MHRFFVETPIVSQQAVLTDSEAHHLLHVLRARPGMEVILFDDSGAEYLAEVSEVGRQIVELEVIERLAVSREAEREVVLGIALPKGDRQKWVVEKLVELGASRLVPMQTERSVAQPNEKTLHRLRRAVIEASKQCGRNRLMEIAGPQNLSDFISKSPQDSLRLLAHPGKDLHANDTLASSVKSSVYLAIGPEGGFSDEEVEHGVAGGWLAVTLGERILRIETAALALTTLAVLNGPPST